MILSPYKDKKKYKKLVIVYGIIATFGGNGRNGWSRAVSHSRVE
jgi:hypothetical protein